jgi:dihydroflavonol-4-reductase
MAPDTLVLGSNGYLGLHVVDALRAEGVDPRCGRRPRSNVLGLRSRKARMVAADLDDPASLDAAMQGVDTVVHVAGHYPRTSTDRAGTMALGERQSRAVIAAARQAGVSRLVYVSSTATVAPRSDGPSTEADRFAAPPGFGLYHDLKWTMEAIFEGATDLDVRVALPAGCIGPGDLRLGTSALIVALARGDDPPHPDGVVSLVDPRDAALGIARLALRPDAPRRLVLSQSSVRLHALLADLAGRYGRPPPSAPLSAAAAKALADVAERDAVATRTRPRMVREIVDLVVHGVPLSGRLAETALGLRYRPFTTSLTDFEGWAQRLGFFTPSQEAHP